MKRFLSNVKASGLTGWLLTLIGIIGSGYTAVYKHARGYAVFAHLPSLRTGNLKLEYLFANIIGGLSLLLLVAGMLLTLYALLRAKNPEKPAADNPTIPNPPKK